MASHVAGAGKIRAMLKRLPEAARAEVAGALQDAAKLVQITAHDLAPVKTGRLRAALLSRQAIGTRERGMRVEFGFRTKRLQKEAFYAPFVEYGTRAYRAGDLRVNGRNAKGRLTYRKMKVNVPAHSARPFMRPALDMNIPTIRRTIVEATRRAIRKARRG